MSLLPGVLVDAREQAEMGRTSRRYPGSVAIWIAGLWHATRGASWSMECAGEWDDLPGDALLYDYMGHGVYCLA